MVLIMKIWHEALSFDFTNPILIETFGEKTLFFDIETTGFSAAHTSLYLIGCVSKKNGKLAVDQFFAETPAEEAGVILAFLTFAASYDTILTYNGIGFDIPYLKSRCRILKIPEQLSDFSSIDLYKTVSGLKFLLKLPDYKQKTLETFLGISRTDTFSGGELIEVYKAYVKNPTEEYLSLLKQHNFEDVLHLPNLLTVLSYSRLLNGGFTVLSMETCEYTDLHGQAGNKELILTLENEIPVPCRVSCQSEDYYLTASANKAKLRIRMFQGTLKFFFQNYQDYFYLPDEDMAIHKSVASYVDKAHRKKAAAATCYTKKTGLFLPQYEELFTPAFKQSQKEKRTYFELTNALTDDPFALYRYAVHSFKQIALEQRFHKK